MIANLRSYFDSFYSGLCRAVFDCKPSTFPPLYLYVLWFIVVVIRLYPASLCLWEDEIFDLVVKVDNSWPVALGFTANDFPNHILFCVLSKIIVKATHHYWIEFFYRLPAIISAALSLPLAFYVFSKVGNRFIAIAGSLILCFLPSIVYHASSARTYSLWMFFVIVCWGLATSATVKKHWVRLAIAYFLLGLCHPFGLVLLMCFAVFGCDLGTSISTLKDRIINASLCVPAFLFSIPSILGLARWGKSAFPSCAERQFVATLDFLPQYLSYLFGCRWFNGYEYLWLLFICLGLLGLWKKSHKTAIIFAFFMLCVPAIFVIRHQPGNCPRYEMGALPFVIYTAVTGIQGIFVRAMRFIDKYAKQTKSFYKTIVSLLMVIILILPWFPGLYRNIVYPKHDYRSLFKTYKTCFPLATKLFTTVDEYSCGFSYYGRQNGIVFQVLPTFQAALDSIKTGNGCKGLVYNAEKDPSKTYPWLATNNIKLMGKWEGSESPVLYLFVRDGCGCQ